MRNVSGNPMSSGEVLAEIPQPPERAPRRTPTVRISQASNWVAGMRRSIGEFGKAAPLVRLTLDDGEQLYVQAMTPGPGDDFATFSVYEADDETRLVIVHLDAIRKVEILSTPPSAREKAFVFRSGGRSVGFTSSS
jgi:hypothetical protein